MKFVKTKTGKIYAVAHVNAFGPYKYVCKGDPYKIILKGENGESRPIEGHGMIFLTKDEVVEEFEGNYIDDDDDSFGLTD